MSRRVALRPLSEADLEPLAEVIAAAGVREWWGPIESVASLQAELAEGEAFAIEVGDELAGWLGYEEESEPNYRSVALDIVLAPQFQGRGLGPEALRDAIAWFAERGHHRFTIDPAVANERAIGAYRAVGFREVGILRRYERGADGAWHNNLLMELLI